MKEHVGPALSATPTSGHETGGPDRGRAPRRPAGALGWAGLIVLSGSLSAGCMGYLTGSYDAEMQRVRSIVAELEAKNAALVEECIELRRRVLELERCPAPDAEDGAQTAIGH